MNAITKYEDFTGTIAADGIDPAREDILKEVLDENSIDIDRFTPVGFDFHAGENNNCYFDILCKDSNNPNQLKRIRMNKRPLEAFFRLFKQFNIVAYSKYHEASVNMSIDTYATQEISE